MKKAFFQKIFSSIKKGKNTIRIYIFLGAFIAPFIGVLAYDLLGWYTGKLYTFGITDIKDFYSFWIAAFGVMGIAYNISQNQKRISHQENQLEKQQQQIDLQKQQQQINQHHHQQQIDLQKKSERDNRFAKGVELLGNNSESARMGAAHNLYFLAREFPDNYKEVVFNILCSHIRGITTDLKYQEKFKEQPSNEIQLLVDLLFKPQNDKLIFDELKANLNNAFLDGIDMMGANLSGAELLNTSLKKANLTNANFQGAQMRGSSIEGASRKNINLKNTIYDLGFDLDVEIKNCL